MYFVASFGVGCPPLGKKIRHSSGLLENLGVARPLNEACGETPVFFDQPERSSPKTKVTAPSKLPKVSFCGDAWTVSSCNCFSWPFFLSPTRGMSKLPWETLYANTPRWTFERLALMSSDKRIFQPQRQALKKRQAPEKIKRRCCLTLVLELL